MIFTFENCAMPTEAHYTDENVSELFLPLLRRWTALQKEKGRRIVVFLAAPPAAGKSTLAAFLSHLSRTTPGLTPVTAVGMDGFHRRQAYLLSHTVERNGEILPMVRIKGAPITFDLPLLRSYLERVAAGETVGWPEYDRFLHDPRDNAQQVEGDIVLVEGNYLLLDQEGWRELGQYADFTLKVTGEESMLRQRLIQRHLDTGKTMEATVAMVDGSDLPNIRLCLAHSTDADLSLILQPDGSYTTI
jgi:pantothenate kinase